MDTTDSKNSGINALAPSKMQSTTNLQVQQSFRARLTRLRPYFAGNQVWLFLLICSAVLVALTEPQMANLLGILLDSGFSQGKLALWKVPVAILGLFGIRGFAGFCAQYSLARMSNHAMVKLRTKLFTTVQNAHPSLFSANTASSLVNTVVYEVQIGATLLVNALLTLLKDSLTLVALLGYLLYMNWQLTLIIFAVFPAVAIAMKLLSKRLQKITKVSQNATDELAYVVEENVLAYRAVRLHHAQTGQLERFELLNQQLRRLAMKATIANSAMTPVTQMLAAVAVSAVICIALWQSASSGTSVGNFVSYITAMLLLITPIKHLSDVAGPVTRGLAALERGLDLMDITPRESSGSYIPDTPSKLGELSLEHVTVRYANSEHDALQDVSMTVRPGETVALVGSSGSGKTTLVNLLPRFVDATSGRMLLYGVDIREWNLDTLRQQLSFVSQDVVMLNDTVAANVALGLTPDPQRVHAALDAANLSAHIASLPQGINTLVGHNASQFSGGQRQRLAIARAVYKNAPILILDEATSALDTESEQAVKSALQTLMRDRTTLIIAHRLSTIEHADRIVVMGHGKVIEAGSHAELLARQGAYARLHRLGSATGVIDDTLLTT